YQPVTAGNQTNKNTGPQEANGDTGLKKSVDARQSKEKNVYTQQYIVFPLWSSISSSYKSSDETYKNDTANVATGETPVQKPASENEQALKNVLDKIMDQENEASEQSDDVRKEFEAQCNRELLQGKVTRASCTNSFNTISTPINAASAPRTSNDVNDFTDDPCMPDLEDTTEVQNTGIFGSAFDDEDLDTYNSPFADQVMGAKANFNNMEPLTIVSRIPTTRVHSIHLKDQIIRDPNSAVQTRGMTKKSSREHAMISYIQKQKRTNHKDFQNCLFACFLSQQEPTKIAQALEDESWVEAMQEELIQKVWTLVDLPYGKRLLMDVKSFFLYGTIEEEVYVSQPLGFVVPEFPEKVYKVEKALYGLHQAPRAWYETLSTYLLDNGFYRGQIDKTLFIKIVKDDILLVQMSSMGELTFFLGLQVKQKEDGIFISQDNYVGKILKKFGFSGIRTASTPMETNKALTKDEDGEDVDVHLYRCQFGPEIHNMRLSISWFKTKIHVNNESAIYVVKNPVYHSKTKHIEIRHHFIRDSYRKKLIEMVKIHTDYNVADLLTKSFDVTRFQFLIASIEKTSISSPIFPSKPRVVIYKDIYEQKKMMQETKVHKFSDGTLNRILDKLDHMVKDFKLFKYNPGMETRIWSEDDRRRSKEFMEVIERRLKIRRIFRSLESFVSGRLRDIEYRLISRTE
ncbi:putative ribonuclease H-like domain-containing protein, partial [Tanacetum coccineum]